MHNLIISENAPSQKLSFNILDHLDRIEIVKTTSTEYHGLCPVCGDGGFKIDKRTGAYNAFKCGCDPKDIREAIRPWSEVLEELKANQKAVRPKQYREWVYRDRQGNLLVKVCRTDSGTGNTNRWQEHWDGTKWVRGYGQVKKEDIPIYRYQEIRTAIALGQTIFVAEGETCADILWKMGLPATTNIGGSGKWLTNHTKDLEGAKAIVLSPDRDKPGIKHMEAISQSLSETKTASGIPHVKWLYPFPNSPLWGVEMPENQGLDVVDWIEDGASKEDILAAIEDRPRQLNLGKERSATENDKVIQDPAVDTRPVEEVLLEQVDRIIADNLGESELKAKILALASNFSRGTKDIGALYYSRSEELERLESFKDTKEEVDHLLKIQNYQLKLKNYLQPVIAEPLEKLAVYLGVNNATLLTALLTTAASLLPIDTKLELIKSTKFYARPILYSGICAPSGSGKSPLIKAILDPLFELQKEEDEHYALAEEDYKLQLKEYKKTKNPDFDEPEPPPPPREYFVTDSTSEAIANIQNNQPNKGFLGYFDELKQLIGQSNSYRKGADIEKLLSGRDGSGFKVNRASGKRISCPRSGYSILGGIQPEVLRKQMGDFSDGNGFWARFIWVNQPMQRKPFPDDEVNLDISPLLRSLYEFLGGINQTFVLSLDSIAKYRDWYNFVEDEKLKEAKPALQAVWSKSQRLVGELALIVHCLKYAAHSSQPPEEVEADVLGAAIKLAKFYIGQVKLIHADGSFPSDRSNTYTKLIELSQRKGWITARDVKSGIRSYRDRTPSQVRSLFREIESLGYGVTEGIGSKLKWNYKTVDIVDSDDKNVDRLSTEKKDSESIKNSLSDNNTNPKVLTTVDREKNLESISSKALQPKTVDIVDQKNSPSTKSNQLTLDSENVDNRNSQSSRLSTENGSNLDSVSNRDCQQFVNSLSTENPESQLNQSVDTVSTKTSTPSTLSTNSPSGFQVGERVIVKSRNAEAKIVGKDIESGLYEVVYPGAKNSTWEGSANLNRIE